MKLLSPLWPRGYHSWSRSTPSRKGSQSHLKSVEVGWTQFTTCSLEVGCTVDRRVVNRQWPTCNTIFANHACHFSGSQITAVVAYLMEFYVTVCAFPYVIAFTSDTMEIRLIINGNLVHTMVMPNLNLISSKNDIFFATTAPEFFSTRGDRIHFDGKTDKDDRSSSPPASPHSGT